MRTILGALLFALGLSAVAQAQFNPTAPIIVPDEDDDEPDPEPGEGS